MKLQDKTVLITGAGSGIGKALTIASLAHGARVIAVDLRQESLELLAGELNQDKLTTHPCDISSKDDVSNLTSLLTATPNNVDILINCAGIIQPFVKIVDLDYQSIERVMNVNFYGTIYMTKLLLPHLLTRPEAYVVNVSSMGGFLPVPGQSVYGASKAAVKLFTEALYAEMRSTSVRVSVVFPGATKTNISTNSGVTTPSVTSDSAKEYPMLTADNAAKQIINGILKNKPQIFTGKDSRFMNRFYRLNPVAATNFIAKKMSSLLK